MTPRIHQTGRDWHTPTAPQSEARRFHVHGPILPMARPAHEPPFWQGLGWLAGLAVVAWLFVVMVS